jgi:hypothetical protein
MIKELALKKQQCDGEIATYKKEIEDNLRIIKFYKGNVNEYKRRL